jgi:hypothetical protein
MGAAQTELNMNPNYFAFDLPGIAYATLGVIFILVIRHQNIQRYRVRLEMIQKERLIAMEKGIPIPELPDYDDSETRRAAESLATLMRLNPRWPLGVGSILVVGGIGTTLALFLSQEAYHNRVWSMGLIPIFVGFGLFLHYRVTRPQ